MDNQLREFLDSAQRHAESEAMRLYGLADAAKPSEATQLRIQALEARVRAATLRWVLEQAPPPDPHTTTVNL